MRIPSLGLFLPRGLALGTSLCISEHGLHFSPSIKTSRQFLALSFIQFRFLAFLQVQCLGLGHCTLDSDWYS